MRYRKLGSSDLEVSEISLGSWLTYAGGIEAEQTRACTEAAFEAGINFFDTANVYGRGAAEAAWGEILSERPRDSYVLATKVWGQMSDDPADRGLSAVCVAHSRGSDARFVDGGRGYAAQVGRSLRRRSGRPAPARAGPDRVLRALPYERGRQT